jgi:hypothetical protein
MKAIVLITLFLISGLAIAQKGQAGDVPKIIYKYKKYQKFDFEDLVIEGETGSPGDLSINPRYQRKFKNKLPYRKNFNAEIRKSIERIR